MEQQLFVAGFGGQGVLLIGQLVAKAALHEGYEVSWMPAYGPEMRGGEANCSVVVSDEPIGSPLVTEPPVAIFMNLPSMTKFLPTVTVNGSALYNASLISPVPERGDVKLFGIRCNELAEELGNVKTANMVMLGAYIELTKVVTIDSAMEALSQTFGPKKANLLPINRAAMEKGAEAVKEMLK